MYKYFSLVLLLCGAAFSNDAPFILGRNDEVINVKSKNITMREEEIIITLRKDYYEVDVTFLFFNKGPTENVRLGFPVEALQHDICDKDVYDFKSYINGEIISKTITKNEKWTYEHDPSVSEYIRWFIRDATFQADTYTTSRVTYKALYNSYSDNFVRAGYIYGTGRFWNGAIEKMSIVINHGDDILIENIYFKHIKTSEFTWVANGQYRYVSKNVKPKTIFGDNISIIVQPFDIYGKYNWQFGLTFGNRYDRIFGEEWYSDDVKDWISANEDVSWVWDKILIYKKPTEIRYYTKNQIRLFINFFSAIHGYDFTNPLYKEYFQKINNFGDKNRTKYKVNPNFSENGFNRIERKNVDYLLNLEKKIPVGQ